MTYLYDIATILCATSDDISIYGITTITYATSDDISIYDATMITCATAYHISTIAYMDTSSDVAHAIV